MHFCVFGHTTVAEFKLMAVNTLQSNKPTKRCNNNKNKQHVLQTCFKLLFGGCLFIEVPGLAFERLLITFNKLKQNYLFNEYKVFLLKCIVCHPSNCSLLSLHTKNFAANSMPSGYFRQFLAYYMEIWFLTYYFYVLLPTAQFPTSDYCNSACLSQRGLAKSANGKAVIAAPALMHNYRDLHP